MGSNFVEIILDCSSWHQAQALADELLAKGLAASVELFEVKAEQWRRQAGSHVSAIKLIVTTKAGQQASIRRLARSGNVRNKSASEVLELPATSLSQWLGTVVAGRLHLVS